MRWIEQIRGNGVKKKKKNFEYLRFTALQFRLLELLRTLELSTEFTDFPIFFFKSFFSPMIAIAVVRVVDGK